MTEKTPRPDGLALAAFQPAVDFFTALRAEFVKIGEAMSAAMKQWAESPSGQYLLAVARYYEEHPDELDALIAAREAEVRHDCNCMCGKWNHRGACTGTATTDRLFALDGDPVTVPLCEPCASSIDRQRPVAAL